MAASVSQNNAAPDLPALSWEARGDVFMARQQYAEAVNAYRHAPQDAVVWDKIGVAYQHMNAVDAARHDYERALLIRPDYPEAINNLGATYFEERNYKKAIRLYRHALKLMPHSAVIAANLGTAYFARGQYNNGFEAYHKAFSIDPDVFNSVEALPPVPAGANRQDRAHEDFCLAQLFAEAGMQDRALEYLRNALNEGFSDHNQILDNAVFSTLRRTAQFAQLMKEEGIRTTPPQ